VALFDFARHLVLLVLDRVADLPDPLLQFVLLELQKRLLLQSSFVFVLDLLESVFVLLVQVLYFLYSLVYLHLFALNSILVRLMEVSLFPQLLPRALCLFSDNLSLLQFTFHLCDLFLESFIFIFSVSYQSESDIIESSFLLQLVPFLLEYVHCVVHLKSFEEVPDKVINDNISVYNSWFWLYFKSSNAVRL